MNSQQPLRILILEDNRADVCLLKRALQMAAIDFTAIIFEDGEGAMRYIDQDSVPEGKPMLDLAILDLNVPKCDGAEVLAYIRSSPQLQHIPVVVFSSSPTHVMLHRTAQADCYITKPCELDEFLRIGEQIRDCLHRKMTSLYEPCESQQLN